MLKTNKEKHLEKKAEVSEKRKIIVHLQRMRFFKGSSTYAENK